MAVDADAPDRELIQDHTNQAEDPAEGDGGTDIPSAVADGDDSDSDGGPNRTMRVALVFGVVAAVALVALVIFLGIGAYQAHRAESDRELFVQIARQGALNLTTISYAEADADVKRILDTATGAFYDDFQNRSQPFMNVIKQAKSTSVGTVTEAGLESQNGGIAQVIVAVSVQTSNAGADQQDPRLWRMRLSVQKVDDTAKVANVEFVP